MRQLVNTEKMIAEKLSDKTFESYALIIHHKGEEWVYTSEDVDMDTYFDAASLGKIFPTTTLTLMAIDRGLLSLDDTVGKFFPDAPADKRDITVKHLLTHTSGMIRKEFHDNVADRGRESIAEFIFSVPLEYETGTKYAYCCTAFLILGFIVEKALGMTLDVAFEELICKPLGLTRSCYLIASDEPNAVNCHHNPEVHDIRRDDNNVSRMRGIPAGPGGNYCTAGDLKKFVEAIMRRDERLYGRRIYDLAEQNYTEGLPVLDLQRGYENHGLGYTYVNENCPQAYPLFPDGSIGHDGYTGQSFYLNRDEDLYVILLTNTTRCSAKKYGNGDYTPTRQMRQDMHRAIQNDLLVK